MPIADPAEVRVDDPSKTPKARQSELPFGVTITPANRSCTYARSAG